MKKNRKDKYKVGFYIMDPYTQSKDYDVKGLNLEDAEREFEKVIRKYR